MSPTLKMRATALFDGKIMELYGLTEGISTVLKPEEVAAHMATVGRPMVGVEIAVLDDADRPLPPDEVGEIVGRSAGIMRGYWNRPDATAEIVWRDNDGRLFIRTGDMGRLDHEGYLTITDRKKDMIVSGGINVFASDIEAVVREHPDVVDVAVIAIPDPKWGETPFALVRVRPNAEDLESIRHFANARLARYQHISAIERQDEDFPRNLLGKVLKRELRAAHSRISETVQEN
jgi:acyl-CoA synthetase (AMP-forming)/AMP-acid ligase II